MDEGTNVLRIAQNVALMMGPNWTASAGSQVGNCDARLTGPEGIQLHLRSKSWRQRDKDRLDISHSIPNELQDHRPYDDKTPQIIVLAKKEASAIAKDIRRRLLPDAEARYQLLRDRKREAEQAAAARDWLLERIEAAWGSRSHHLRDSSMSLGGLVAGGITWDAQIMHDGTTVKVDNLQLTGEQAVKLAAFLAKLDQEG